MRYIKDEKRETTYDENERNYQIKKKKIEHSEKRKHAKTWQCWKLKPSKSEEERKC